MRQPQIKLQTTPFKNINIITKQKPNKNQTKTKQKPNKNQQQQKQRTKKMTNI